MGQQITIPTDYTGSRSCVIPDYAAFENFDPASYNDVMIDLGYLILEEFITETDFIVDFSDANIRISTSQVDEIPYLWGPTLLEVIVWQ